jgi:hypothetical protein
MRTNTTQCMSRCHAHKHNTVHVQMSCAQTQHSACPDVMRTNTTQCMSRCHAHKHNRQHHSLHILTFTVSDNWCNKNDSKMNVNKQDRDTYTKLNTSGVINTEIKSISVQTQLNSIYYTELHVSTYFRSSSGSQLVFKTYIHYVVNWILLKKGNQEKQLRYNWWHHSTKCDRADSRVTWFKHVKVSDTRLLSPSWRSRQHALFRSQDEQRTIKELNNAVHETGWKWLA